MGDRGWLLFLAVAFGAGVVPGAYLRSQGNAAAPADAAGRTVDPASVKEKDKSGVQPSAAGEIPKRPDTAEGKLHEIFDAFDPGLSVGKDSAVEVAEEYRREGHGQIFSLVATVPDPEKSSFDASYDQSLDAIQRAAESEGFLPDRYYLPWRESGDDSHRAEPEGVLGLGARLRCGNVSVQCKDASARKPAPALRLPGILLFRRVWLEQSSLRGVDLLVVLVVGELPKSGLYQQAFAEAIDLACMLRRDGREPLRVLGPHFSGAALSLRLGLLEHGRRHGREPHANSSHPARKADGSRWPAPAVQVISGSALDADNPLIITFDLHEAGSASFETTSIPARELQAAVLDAIKRRLGERELRHEESGDIALLSEYGTQWVASTNVGKSERIFHFPLHVAHLRARREKSKHDSASDSPVPLRDRLALLLDRDRDSTDDLPAGSALTPYNIEIMLHDQLAEISREHIRFLGVLATDPTDLVFIVQEARKYCPGVQIFTLGSHALFSHPDLMRDLNGVLIASTYPLAALWTRHGETFASYAAEGTYNAVVAMLGRLGAHEAVHPPRYKDWGDPFDKKHTGPQIWLGMVSNSEIWPFHVGPPEDPSSLVKEASQAGRLAHGPPLGDLVQGLYWLMLVLALLHAYCLYARDRRRRHLLAPVDRADGVAQVIAMSGAMLFTWILWVVVALQFVENDRWLVWLSGAAAVVAVLVPLALAIRELHRACVHSIDRRREWEIACSPALVLVATVMVFASLELPYLSKLYFAGDSPDVRLGLGRMVQPLSGVSPALPLLWVALGLYLWGVAGLRRARARTRLPRTSPFPLVCGRWLEKLDNLAKGIRSAYAKVIPRREQGIALFIVFVPCCFFLDELLPTFESDKFDRLFQVAFLLLVAAVVGEAGQLLARWWQLRHLLQRLARHPMLDAYARAGGDGSPWFRLEVVPEIPSPDELGEAMKVVDLACKEPSRARRLREGLMAETHALAKLRGEAAHDVSGVHAHLFRFARLLYIALDRLWQAGQVVRARKDGQPLPLEALTGPDRSIATAEVLAARQVLTLIRFALGQLRARMVFIVAGSLMLAFAVGSYPFHPMRFASVFVWAIVLGVLGVVLWVIFGVEYDVILSRTAHTRPGHIDFNFAFVSKVLLYGLAPGVVLLATAFPEVGDLLFSWLGPVLRAFHH